MSAIPSFPSARRWGERALLSVANLTRADARPFFAAATAGIVTRTHPFPLARANEAIAGHRAGSLNGTAVLVPLPRALRWIKAASLPRAQAVAIVSSGGHAMRQYLVNFYKVVTDDHGHDRSILQHQALVRARSEVSALFEAKAMFREAMGVADWRLRADACEAVTLADVAA